MLLPPLGRGGPNWRREFYYWQKDSEAQGTLISPTKKRIQLGMAAMCNNKPKSIVRTSNAYKKKLVFADYISYAACNGYSVPDKPRIGVNLPETFRNNSSHGITVGSSMPSQFM
jgi:hypothetical protein